MKSTPDYSVNVHSEIGELEAVIIHSMGAEVENMTPENAERALYSDILNLSVAQKEYAQFRGALQKLTKVFEVKDLLQDLMEEKTVKEQLIKNISNIHIDMETKEFLLSLDAETLAKQMIEGVILKRDTLVNFLSKQRYSLRPLHNFFFTRDASVSIYDNVMISKMASSVREREAHIMQFIFDHNTAFNTRTFNASSPISKNENKRVSIEGGDVLIAREDVLLIGIGARTTPEGVDVLVNRFREQKKHQHIIVQELPTDRESFIHLDMVFTFLNHNECMVYEPVVLQPNRFKTIHIETDNGKVKISEEKNIPEALAKLGFDLKSIYCGGKADQWTQEREQWHSGANFFAVGPGKVIGYNRNIYTIDELNKNGYEIINATDLINDTINHNDYKKFVITIDGSELARGGGGARCMTMPVKRRTL